MAFVDVGAGVNLFYEEWGKGQTIVFVHAWSLDHAFFENQALALMASGKRVITYDHRGHGKSDRPNGAYDIATYADDLAALINKLDLRDIVLVSWSMGTYVASTYVKKAPERVAKMVYVGATPLLVKQPGWEHGMEMATLQKLAEELATDRTTATESFYRALLNKNTSQQRLDWIVRTSLSTPLPVIMQSFQSLLATDWRDACPAIKVPTLICQGTQDGSVSVGTAEYLTAKIAGAKLVKFSNSGHFPQIEENASFTANLLEFIG